MKKTLEYIREFLVIISLLIPNVLFTLLCFNYLSAVTFWEKIVLLVTLFLGNLLVAGGVLLLLLIIVS